MPFSVGNQIAVIGGSPRAGSHAVPLRVAAHGPIWPIGCPGENDTSRARAQVAAQCRARPEGDLDAPSALGASCRLVCRAVLPESPRFVRAHPTSLCSILSLKAPLRAWESGQRAPQARRLPVSHGTGSGPRIPGLPDRGVWRGGPRIGCRGSPGIAGGRRPPAVSRRAPPGIGSELPEAPPGSRGPEPRGQRHRAEASGEGRTPPHGRRTGLRGCR